MVRDEATTVGGRAQRVDLRVVAERASRARRLDAGEVPVDGAAEVVDVANAVAADRVGAAGLSVHGAAGARGGVGWIGVAADALALTADFGGDFAAERVPAGFAAKLIGGADGFAADAIVAIGGFVLMAAVARARIAAGEAEAIGPSYAALIPRSRAAGGVDGADARATSGVVAVGVLVHDQARTGRGFTAGVGEFDRLLNTGGVPLKLAAVLGAEDFADGLADDAVVAGWRGMRGEAALGNGAATRAVLLRDGDANIIPGEVATGRLDGADQSAAVGIVAARRNEIGREAGVGCGRARGLRVRAAANKQQCRDEQGGEDRDGAQRSHGGSKISSLLVAVPDAGSVGTVRGVHEVDGGHHGVVSRRALPELRPVVSLNGAPISENPRVDAAL